MSHKPFLAGHWLARDIESLQKPHKEDLSPIPSASPVKNKFPSFNNKYRKKAIPQASAQAPLGFQAAQFFTPGWRGDSLTSKASSKFTLLLDTLQEDVAKTLTVQEFNRSLSLGIYNEFLSYAKEEGALECELDDLARFWKALKSDSNEERPEILNAFIRLYCYRVAVITLFKLRFISMLSLKANIPLSNRCSQNPNHWLAQIFKTGTRHELKARVTEANIFSWYRPKNDLTPVIEDWMKNSVEVTIAELIKLTSPRVQGEKANSVYSHSLSHLNFGLFLNSLLINFPLWMEAIEPLPYCKFQTPEELEIISCKYSGDYLESLALSHWLAQLNNIDMKWDQILCPVFKGKDFESGLFFKVLNELQFLTFLAEVAETQQQTPVDFIAGIMGHHYKNRKGTQALRGLSLDTPFSTSTYDRNILNLTHLPKNNPYHFLMGQIDDQAATLKAGGWLFVLSSKSLFAPSQKERLKIIQEDLEIKAVIDLENVKGKGELSNWLYIFRKRMPHVIRSEKESIAWFRLSADMKSFHDFAEVTDLLRDFYISHLEEAPGLWQKDYGTGYRLDFYQDALIDGHLIHAASEDQSRVTHPRFFKSLMANCVPLESVFELRPMNPDEWQNPHSLNIGLNLDGATFLMVDCRYKDQTKITLHPIATFRAIYFENGSSLCHYYLISSKHNGINPNILRKYFSSQMGQQLVNLSFSSQQSKVKSQLAKLLVPKWFQRSEFLPENLRPALEMFTWDAKSLTSSQASELTDRFKYFKQSAKGLFNKYACDLVSSLVSFEQTLETLVSNLSDPRLGSQINFQNPELQKALSELPSYPILRPVHPDVYVEFLDDVQSEDLNSVLTRVDLKSQVDGELRLWSLEFSNNQRVICRLHSDEGMLLFAQFIAQFAIGRSIGQLIKALRLPSLTDMQRVVGQAKNKQSVFNELLMFTSNYLEECFRTQFLTESP